MLGFLKTMNPIGYHVFPIRAHAPNEAWGISVKTSVPKASQKNLQVATFLAGRAAKNAGAVVFCPEKRAKRRGAPEGAAIKWRGWTRRR